MTVDDDVVAMKFDKVTSELKAIAEEKNLDLSTIKISNKQAEKYERYYNYNKDRFGIPLACYYN